MYGICGFENYCELLVKDQLQYSKLSQYYYYKLKQIDENSAKIMRWWWYVWARLGMGYFHFWTELFESNK